MSNQERITAAQVKQWCNQDHSDDPEDTLEIALQVIADILNGEPVEENVQSIRGFLERNS